MLIESAALQANELYKPSTHLLKSEKLSGILCYLNINIRYVFIFTFPHMFLSLTCTSIR